MIANMFVENWVFVVIIVVIVIGIFVWKNQSTGLFDPTRKVFRKSNNPHHISGVSDILGILKDGRFLAIEVKKPYVSKKTLKFKYRTQEELQKLASVDQVNFLEKIRLSNGVSFYADSLDVVEQQLSIAKIA